MVFTNQLIQNNIILRYRSRLFINRKKFMQVLWLHGVVATQRQYEKIKSNHFRDQKRISRKKTITPYKIDENFDHFFSELKKENFNQVELNSNFQLTLKNARKIHFKILNNLWCINLKLLKIKFVKSDTNVISLKSSVFK